MYLECQAVHLPLVHHLLNALFPLIVPNMPFLPRWTSISWHVPSFFPMGFCSYFMSCVARSHIFPKNIWCFDNSYVEWPMARATRVECSNKGYFSLKYQQPSQGWIALPKSEQPLQRAGCDETTGNWRPVVATTDESFVQIVGFSTVMPPIVLVHT